MALKGRYRWRGRDEEGDILRRRLRRIRLNVLLSGKSDYMISAGEYVEYMGCLD